MVKVALCAQETHICDFVGGCLSLLVLIYRFGLYGVWGLNQVFF